MESGGDSNWISHDWLMQAMIELGSLGELTQ